METRIDDSARRKPQYAICTSSNTGSGWYSELVLLD